MLQTLMQKRALLSVSDKTGITDLAKKLSELGYEILSTGGTARALEEAKIKTTPVEEITGFPECFSGRVKTMHPMITGGILMKRNDKEHQKQAKDLKIDPIDVIVINLYPFEETTKKKDATEADVIEQIDIGGPTLLRSAAKNFNDVIALCDPADYDRVLDLIAKEKMTTEVRKELATKVFLHTAKYDALITDYLSGGMNHGVIMHHGTALRYGENPHQWGKFFLLNGAEKAFTMHQGKELSYLNVLDGDGAWNMAMEFEKPTAVMVKHANPSGIASDENINVAFQKAYDTDRLSAFGVIIAINRECTEEIAKKIIDQKIFTELLMAPSFEKGALEILKQKPNIRVLSVPVKERKEAMTTYRTAMGGMLVQDEDISNVTEKDLKVVTKKAPTKEQIQDLLFAWKVVKHAKSNAIVLAKNSETVGIGCGQTSRVDSTWIALKRAGDRAKDAVLASDAFFPFPDAIEEAAKGGVVAMIQPGGSIRDEEVIKRADELGIAMVTTGVRVFRH